MKIFIFFSTFSPLIAAYLGGRIFVFLPSILLTVFFFIKLIKFNFKICIYYKKFYILLTFIFLITLYQNLIGLGVPSGGVLLLLFQVFIYYQIFNLDNKYDLKYFIGLFIFIYLAHLLYLYVELFLRANGFEYLFIKYFDNHYDYLKGFKDYNTASTLLTEYIGIKGLNSAMLGSQIASVLTLISTILFFLIIWVHNFKMIYLSIFLTSFVCYILSTTQTSNLISLIIISFYFIINFKYFLISKLHTFIFGITILIILYIVSFDVSFKDLIFFRIRNSNDLNIYLNLFIEPYREYFSFSLHEILFGVGNIEWNFDSQTDLGFFAILYRVGIIFFVLVNILFFIFLFKLYKIYKISKNKSSNLALFYIFNLNALFIYYFSLIHYTNTIELGARELVAFHIASTLHILKNEKLNKVK